MRPTQKRRLVVGLVAAILLAGVLESLLFGVESLDELLDRAVPESIRTREPLDLPPAAEEAEARRRLRGEE